MTLNTQGFHQPTGFLAIDAKPSPSHLSRQTAIAVARPAGSQFQQPGGFAFSLGDRSGGTAIEATAGQHK
jgi:hypothetical protein